MNRWLRWTPILLLPLAAFIVHEPRDTVVVPAAFRWRNDNWMGHQEYDAIKNKQLQRVYHKLLDIDWNAIHGAHPISTVRVPYQWRGYSGHDGDLTNTIEFVPCVYITNHTFLKIDNKEVDQLGHNLLRKLRMECPDKIGGVMLDCDWTATTKTRFFRLVRLMNDSLDVPLVATIRLHQYAAPKKTGVPPADRGMLMVYNVGRLQEPGATNSIFDEELASPYFAHEGAYPLPLDIALPAYSWGIQFRNGRFIGILHDDQLQSAFEWGMLGPEHDGSRQVIMEQNDAVPELHLGDEVRIERITPELMDQAAALASKAVNSDTVCVAFFEIGARAFQELEPARSLAITGRFGTVRAGPWPEVPDPLTADTMAWPVVDTVAMDSTR